MNVALIGYGVWGKILRKYLEQSENFNLIYIYTSQLNIEKGVYDIELLKQNDVEAVFIASPSETHYYYSKIFLDSNKHVFCEKPFSNVENLNQLLDLANLKSKIFYVNYIYLLSPSIHKMGELLPKIGEISFANFRIGKYVTNYKNENAFEVLGCHLLAVFFYICGSDIKFSSEIKIQSHNQGNFQQIVLQTDSITTIIECCLLDVEKNCKIEIVGESGFLYFTPLATNTISLFGFKNNELLFKEYFNFDETNNLFHSLNHFRDLILGKENTDVAVLREVTRILDLIRYEQL